MIIESTAVQLISKAATFWAVPTDSKNAVNQFHLVSLYHQPPQGHIYRTLFCRQIKAIHDNGYKLVININVGVTHKQEIYQVRGILDGKIPPCGGISVAVGAKGLEPLTLSV